LEHGLVEFVRVRSGRHVEPLSEQRDLCILDAEFQHRSGRNDHHAWLRLLRLAASELKQLLAERLELRLVGLEAPEIGSGVGTDGDRFQDLRRIGERKCRIEILAQPERLDATAARILGVVEHGIADLHLGVGDPVTRLGVGGIEAGGIGQGVIGGGEAIVVGLADLRHDLLGALGEAVLIDPEERLLWHQVIFDQGVLLRLVGGRVAGLCGKPALHADAQSFLLLYEARRSVRFSRVARQADSRRHKQP